ADRAEQESLVAADLLERRVRERFPGPVPALGAQVVVGLFDREPGGLEHLERLGHHLRADPVAADHGELYLRSCHARTLLVTRGAGVTPVVPAVQGYLHGPRGRRLRGTGRGGGTGVGPPTATRSRGGSGGLGPPGQDCGPWRSWPKASEQV